jgi:hypothetical protein
MCLISPRFVEQIGLVHIDLTPFDMTDAAFDSSVEKLHLFRYRFFVSVDCICHPGQDGQSTMASTMHVHIGCNCVRCNKAVLMHYKYYNSHHMS